MSVFSRAACLAALSLSLVFPAWAQDGDRGEAPSHEAPSPAAKVPTGERVEAATVPLERIGQLPLAGPVDPDIYRVGPGDLLQVQLWGRFSRTLVLEVGPEGTMQIPDIGTLQVDGRTLTQVRAEALRRLHEEFRGVSMDLRLARPRTFVVYLTGSVNTRGPTVATGASRVGDVVSQASLAPGASLRRVSVLHRDGSKEMADLDLFLRTGEHALNPWLRDGDVIQIPIATEFIYAYGALASPGIFELGPADSLLTLFKLSGEPLPSADPDRVLLVRWKAASQADSVWLRIGDVYSHKLNPALRGGDRLYVYFIPKYHVQDQVKILGEVARPGAYPILEGRHRLSYLVSAAGGFLPTADLSSIRVHRQSTAAGEKDPELERLLRLSRAELTASEYEALRTKLAGLREDYRVDWSRLSQSKDLDLLLRDGDEVRVERLVSSIRVDGEVRRPGIVAFLPGRKFADYVEAAGGFTDRAWRSRVRITRSVTGQTLLARNVRALHPGDLVWVPEKPDRSAWEQSRDILTAIAQVATVVIAIRTVR